jgi:hypothetical protein
MLYELFHNDAFMILITATSLMCRITSRPVKGPDNPDVRRPVREVVLSGLVDRYMLERANQFRMIPHDCFQAPAQMDSFPLIGT